MANGQLALPPIRTITARAYANRIGSELPNHSPETSTSIKVFG